MAQIDEWLERIGLGRYAALFADHDIDLQVLPELGDEPPEAQLAKLEAVLGQSSERLDEVVPLFAALLGVPTGDRYPALTLTPEVQERRTLQVLADQLAGLATRQPVLALYEDLHWVDPSTLELLGLVMERIRRLPVLALITFRPEFQPPWTGHAHVTTLTMSRLGRRQGGDLVARVAGEKPLPAEVVELIVARTDGVPLFVEELTKTVLESGLLADAGDRYALHGPLPPLAIPATLHDSLMARLDRLAPGKEVAQIAAVIGREFSHELLTMVSPLSQADLNAALDQLVSSELIFRRGGAPQADYSFKHTLVQDAAYQSLLKSTRQQLHARIAQALEGQFPDIVAGEPELLARHWTEARAAQQAARYWRRAGMRASERFAYVEAVHYFRTALRLLDDLPPSEACDRHELLLWLALGPALLSKGSWNAPEVGEAYQRAHELARQVGGPSELFAATWGLWLHSSQCAKHDAARRLSAELITVAERRGDPEMLLQSHHAAWTTHEHLGDPVSCREHALRGIELYRADRHHSHVLSYGGHDPGVCARLHDAGALWQLGYPDQALQSAHDAVALGRQLAHPSSIVMAMYTLATIHWWRREVEPARRCADEVIAFCRQHEIAHILGSAEVMRGWGIAVAEGRSAGIAEIEQGLTDLEVGGPQLRRADCLIMLSEARRSSSEFGPALDAVEQAKLFLSSSGLRRSAPEVARLEGELLLANDGTEPGRAEACFHKALAMARDQHARSLELRAAMSLARLRREQSRRAEARELLAPVYGWFTEGFDTADLTDAKALLDELS